MLAKKCGLSSRRPRSESEYPPCCLAFRPSVSSFRKHNCRERTEASLGVARQPYVVELKWWYGALTHVFLHSYKHFLFVSLCRPFIMTAQEPVIILLGTYLAFIYGIIYCASLRHDSLLSTEFRGSRNCVAVVLTTFPPIYTEIYHEKPGVVGLQYISLGLGMHLGCIVI